MAQPPTEALLAGNTLGTDSIPLRVRWPAATDAAPSSGTAAYQVQQRTKEHGQWGSWRTVSRTAARAMTRRVQPGTHQFRVRARDGAGVWSTWKTGSSLTLKDPQAGSSVTFGGSWSAQRSRVFYERSTRYAKARGASAVHVFTAREVAWVASRGPDRGRARVYVDGQLKAIVDLFSPSRRNRKIVFARKWSTTSSHTIRIKVVGRDAASSSTRVGLDAFLTLDYDPLAARAPAPPAVDPLDIIAHRGDGNGVDGYPENTLEAATLAAARGADKVELDVRWSADGTPWLNHDATVDRTTDGTGLLASMADAQLADLHVDGGYGYSAERHGTTLRLAPLADVLDALSDTAAAIRFDDKGNSGATLVQFLIDHDWALTPDRTEVATHSQKAADAIEAFDPEVRTIAAANLQYSPDHYDGWTVAYTDASAALFADLGGYDGFYTGASNRDDAMRVEDAIAWGAHSITVNDLPGALAVRDQLIS